MLFLTLLLLSVAVLDRSLGEEETEEDEEEEEEGDEEEEEGDDDNNDEKEEEEEDDDKQGGDDEKKEGDDYVDKKNEGYEYKKEGVDYVDKKNKAYEDRKEGDDNDEKKEGDDEDDDEEEDDNLRPDIQKAILDTHNKIRSQVQPTAANMLKMVWNDTVAQNAKKWAEQCILANSAESSRKLGDMLCGENMFQSNRVTKWEDVIHFWNSGKEYFKYGVGAEDPTKNVFAYTQLVWYNSYILGCAVGFCPDITFPHVYVCQYCPGGNFMSQVPKPYKEGKSCGDCPHACENNLCTNPCKRRDLILNCREMKKVYSCRSRLLINGCRATCRCKKEII